jgi:hypothetical protein
LIIRAFRVLAQEKAIFESHLFPFPTATMTRLA